MIFLKSIHHDGSGRYVSNLYPRLGLELTIRLRMSPDAPIHLVCDVIDYTKVDPHLGGNKDSALENR